MLCAWHATRVACSTRGMWTHGCGQSGHTCPFHPRVEPTAHGPPIRRHVGVRVPGALAHVDALLRVLAERVECSSPIGANHEVNSAAHEGLLIVVHHPHV